MMCMKVACVCISLLLIGSMTISRNVFATLPSSFIGETDQPIKMTIAAKKIIIPHGAADQGVEFYYQPKEVTISNDTSVTWVNHDSAIHTATADNGSFDTGIIPIDANATLIIIGSGNIEYHCTIHPWMQGTITVASSSGYNNSQQKQLQHLGLLGKSAALTPHMLTTHKILKPLSRSVTTDLGTEPEHKNDWITANHDIFGTILTNINSSSQIHALFLLKHLCSYTRLC
jgi:plastocyanin